MILPEQSCPHCRRPPNWSWAKLGGWLDFARVVCGHCFKVSKVTGVRWQQRVVKEKA